MRNFYPKKVLTFLVAAFATGSVLAAPFKPGNIVVARVGDGSAALSGAAAAVFLDEYTPAGVLVQSVPLPTSVSGNNRILTAAGNATTELALTRSADGRYLVLTGYGTAPGTASVVTSATTAVARVIGLIGADGSIDTSTNTGAFDGVSIRGAATADGTSFYSVGANSGVRYQALGSFASTPLSTTPTNVRSVNVVGGNLYIATASNPFIGLNQVGTGLPTTAGQTVTALPGFPGTTAGASPYGFYLADLDATVPGVDVAYVADDRAAAGIQKWSLVNNAWVLNGTITGSGVRGIQGSASGTAVALVASSANGASLYAVADNAGYNAAPSQATLPAALATASPNTAFRGVALAPVAPAPAIASLAPASGPVGTTVTVAGSNFTGATAVTLNGVAVPSFTVASATTLTFVVPAGATSGAVAVTTQGGTATSTTSFTVLAAPAVASFAPASGPVGATVTVTGSNLTGATAVTLNGTTITNFAVVDAATLTFVVPAGAASGVVAVTTPGGTATSTTSFTVLAAPAIASLAPASGPVGTIVTVTGSSFTGATAVTLNGVAVPGFTVVDAATLAFVVPAGATSGVVAVTTLGGTATSATSFTVTVPVLAPTIVSFTPATGGAGTTITVTGTNLTGATAVSIGTLAIPNFTVVSATSLTLVLPTTSGVISGPLTVTTPGGTATSTANFSFVMAAQASQALPELAVYPNPAADYVWVTLPQGGSLTVSLRDLLGRQVLVPAVLAARQPLRLPASLAPGVYLLEVRQGTTTAVRRIEKK